MAAVWDSEDFSTESCEKKNDDGDYKWVYVQEQWLPAKVERAGGCMIATLEDGKRMECNADQVFDKVLSLAGLKRLPDNLIHTDDMSEQTIIYLINQKYNSDLIYTSIGDILVAVNPYRLLPLYTPLVMHKYMVDDMDMSLRPHPYAVARRSYDLMLEHSQPQSILISGESGAGKTETTKLCLSFLSEIATSDVDGSQGMEQKILASNPILESFGNAKTLCNNNSSRSGKFINLIFNKEGVLQGCETKNFLLEKSRVHMQAFGERSYHIFYELCRASLEESDCFSMGEFGDIAKTHDSLSASSGPHSSSMRANLSSLGLKHPDDFCYLNQSGCTDIYLVSDQENFHEMEFAATKLGFSKKQLNMAFSACACVLHLGNLSFVNSDHARGGCSLGQDSECAEALRHVALLLDVSESVVAKALTTKEFMARGEKTLVLLTAAQANETRDALAKAIYTKCFDFLINVINVELSVEAFQGRRATAFTPPTTIGVLDIYGFEVFEMNGFEQLLINYANEKLQQHFNHHTFEEEIKACERENISCEDFTYLDNQDTLDLIESKLSGNGGGILRILDDECKFPRGTDEAFLNKLKISQKNSRLISFSRKFTDLGFDVVHYAGSVNYTVKDFLEKNKDTLSTDLEHLMRNSSVKFLSSGDCEDVQFVDIRGKAKAKQLTVAGKFQKDLNNLLVQLNESVPHFIRCIKPNEEKEPMIFNHAMVHRQLKQSGAFDALSIRKRGFQFQFPHAVFLQRYRPLVVKHNTLDPNKPIRYRCVDLISTLSTKIPGMRSLSKNMQVGDTMVFWKSAEDVMLSELRKEIVRAAVLVLQRFLRGGVIRCGMLKVQKVISESRKLLLKHRAVKESGELVTFESECEIFQALTINKDFFEASKIRPYFEKVLADALQELEDRIDCINQLQLHHHKSLKNIDAGWLAATERAIALGLRTVESVHMINIHEKEVKTHGVLLVSVLEQLQSPDVAVHDIQKCIDSIDEVREEDPDFACELSRTLKKNVVMLEEENKMVSDLLQTAASEKSNDAKDCFLPFQNVTDKEESLSRNFTLVLKVVDYVVELRDIVLTTLLSATGEDPSTAPFFPPPVTPKESQHAAAPPHEDREVDFDDDGFESAAIANMSGHVSMKAIELELWSSSMKHFHLFEEIARDLADREEFRAVVDLAAQEVAAYKEAVTLCHSVVQECGAVLSNCDVSQSAITRQKIDQFNEYISEHCRLLTVDSSKCLNDADNVSHPYFLKRIDIRNKKLLAAQSALLLQMETASHREEEACESVLTAASACSSAFGAGDFRANERCVSVLMEAVAELRVCAEGAEGFFFPTTESLCAAAEYSIQVRQLANELLVKGGSAIDMERLDQLEEIIMKSYKFERLDAFFSQSELNTFREQTFTLKVKNNELMDSRKQFISDLGRAVANEDEGLLLFLLGKVSAQEFAIDEPTGKLVEQGRRILDRCQQLKKIVEDASRPQATVVDIQGAISQIKALDCRGSDTFLGPLQCRLDVLLRCGQRIHSVWYDSPNCVENMVGALQECKQHDFPPNDDVRFVQRFVDLWREDYALYLKALIDLRTFLEDTEAVTELNEELNKLYMQGKDMSSDDDEAEEAGPGRQSDVGNRITEDLGSNGEGALSSHMNGLTVSTQPEGRSEQSPGHGGGSPVSPSRGPMGKKKHRRVTRNNPSFRRTRATSDTYVERNQDAYKWYKYPKLRTFTDPERERQRKVYTTKNLPTSVSRLDNIIHIQLATAAFKCLLGIMGDKVGSYPEMLKKEFLRIAAYHITLTDELYCQVMKQLTKNPSRVSKTKGVDLLQTLVSTVLPTTALQPYFENFLRSHGALEFVNLLRVLSTKKTIKAERAAEQDNEGWLFTSVGRIMKSYRKRWCVLHGDTLSLFMTQDHSSKIDSFPVSQIKGLQYLKKKDENVKAMYAFEIEMKSEKSHVFYTVNDQDRTRWVEKTKAAVYMYWSQGSKK